MEMFTRYPACSPCDADRLTHCNSLAGADKDLAQVAVQRLKITTMVEPDINPQEVIVANTVYAPVQNGKDRIVICPEVNPGMKGIFTGNRMDAITIAGSEV